VYTLADRRAKIAELQGWLAGVHQNVESDNARSDASTLAPTDAVGVPTGAFDKTVYGADDIAPPPPPDSYGVEELKKQRERDEDRADKKRRQSYRDKLAEAKEAERQQEIERKREIAERSEIEKTYRGIGALAQSMFQMGKGAFHRSRSRLEDIPTPGDLWVPLALLLFFFLVLFPVNGHTRIMWLWMTITGNAQIGGALPQPTMTPVTPQAQPLNTQQQLQNFINGQQAGTITTPPGHAPGHGPAPPGGGSGPPFTSTLNGYTNYASLLQGLE
jgi:hypothetical protein